MEFKLFYNDLLIEERISDARDKPLVDLDEEDNDNTDIKTKEFFECFNPI